MQLFSVKKLLNPTPVKIAEYSYRAILPDIFNLKNDNFTDFRGCL